MNFQVEWRARIRKLFPGHADFPRLLFAFAQRPSVPTTWWWLASYSRAQNAVPQIVGGHHRQANRLAAFFRHRQRLVNRCCSMLPNS